MGGSRSAPPVDRTGAFPPRAAPPCARAPSRARLGHRSFLHQALAVTAALALLTGAGGCFGYNKSARRWAYVGDAILIAAGGATIALDVTSTAAPCMPDAMNNGCSYKPPVDGGLIAGVVLAAAGVFGVLFNATRDDVKTSR